jgi:hypothetical protein
MTEFPDIFKPDSVTVWFCTKDGRAMKVSSIADEEFDYDPQEESPEGRCDCGAPLRKAEYIKAEQREASKSNVVGEG